MTRKPKPKPQDDDDKFFAAIEDATCGLLFLDQHLQGRQMPEGQRHDLIVAAVTMIHHLSRLQALNHTITLAKANASQDVLFELFNQYHNSATQSITRYQTLKLLVKDQLASQAED